MSPSLGSAHLPDRLLVLGSAHRGRPRPGSSCTNGILFYSLICLDHKPLQADRESRDFSLTSSGRGVLQGKVVNFDTVTPQSVQWQEQLETLTTGIETAEALWVVKL